MPHVMHGPRIEDDGLSGGLAWSLGRNVQFEEQDPLFTPSVYGGLRLSHVPSAGDGQAVSVGLQVPLLLAPLFWGEDESFRALAATSYADAYVQPMRRSEPGVEWGIGALASSGLRGPYVQFGRDQPDQKGWYTTHLLAFVADDYGPFIREGLLYMPSVAIWSRNARPRGTPAHMSAGLGLGGQGSPLVVVGFLIEVGTAGR